MWTCLTRPLLMLLSILNILSTIFAIPIPVTDTDNPEQYHIQTDEGKRRFFKYRTKSGSFRKETLLDDGTVVGSYGWVDANGILRVYDYIADDNGYRVTKDSAINLDEDIVDSVNNNLIEPNRDPQRKNNNSFKTSNHHRQLRKKNIIKRKKKAQFALPEIDTVKSLPSIRHERRIAPDFVPIFDINEINDLTPPTSKSSRGSTSSFSPDVQITPTTTATSTRITPRPPPLPTTSSSSRPRTPSRQTPRVSSLPLRKIQPRGEGYRTSYVPLTRRGFRTPATPRRPQGSRFYVVKRKRNPNSISVNRRNQEEEDNEVDVEPATSSVNYQTTKSFHREATLDSGERHGEYGYIDPIGVRRVVTYSTGSRGGIHKGKENDYVGPNTYFEAN